MHLLDITSNSGKNLRGPLFVVNRLSEKHKLEEISMLV